MINNIKPKIIISSQQNSSVQLCLNLLANSSNKDKKKYFIAEGHKLIKTLIQKYKPFLLLTTESFLNELNDLNDYQPQIQIVSDKLWLILNQDLLSPTKLIGVFEKPANKFKLNHELENGFYLILDRIQDPGNMGTLLRTAAAANWQNIISLKGSVDIFSPKVIRASAGAIAHLNIMTSIEEEILKENLASQGNDFSLICTSSHAKTEINQLNLLIKNKSKIALVLGNEGQGIAKSLMNLERAELIKIPMNEQIESLNVSVAGALLIFKLSGLV